MALTHRLSAAVVALLLTAACGSARHGDQMNCVHLEVWRDFQGQVINKSAAEWIYRNPTDGINEPWVFVVRADGTIIQRFDNVASEDELENAVKEAVA